MKNSRAVAERIRASVDLLEVAHALGIEVPPGRKITSFSNPHEKTPSLHVYDDHWYDYSTGEGGDQIAFVRKATGASFGKAVKFLQGKAKLGAKPRQRRDDWQDMTGLFNDRPEPRTMELSLRYLDQLDLLIADKWPVLTAMNIFEYGSRIVDLGELWTPHHHPDRPDVVVGIKTRDLVSGSKRSVPGSRFLLGWYRVAPLERGDLWIVEGESDVWSMTAAGYQAVGLPSGASTIRADWADQVPRGSSIHLALDGDDAGRGATERLLEMFPSATVVEAPGGRVSEALGEGWRP